jgi:hypothetical protein
MAANNIVDQNPPPPRPEEEPENKKPYAGMGILGWNLLALAVYTLLMRAIADNGGFIFDAFFLFIHVLTCLMMAIIKRSWFWLLGGLLVLAIGFSTCAMMVNLR